MPAPAEAEPRHGFLPHDDPDALAFHTYASIIVATSDLDGVFERVQASGAEAVAEPADRPYDVRDCASATPRAT